MNFLNGVLILSPSFALDSALPQKVRSQISPSLCLVNNRITQQVIGWLLLGQARMCTSDTPHVFDTKRSKCYPL